MSKTLIFALCVLAVFAIDPPIFPEQYEVKFNETTKSFSSGSTKGAIYFDSTKNSEVITRENGHHDRYCGTVYKFTDTPCNHYVINGKKFFLWQEGDLWISPRKNTAAIAATQPMDVELSQETG
jgi:hypothetical protein